MFVKRELNSFSGGVPLLRSSFFSLVTQHFMLGYPYFGPSGLGGSSLQLVYSKIPG